MLLNVILIAAPTAYAYQKTLFSKKWKQIPTHRARGDIGRAATHSQHPLLDVRGGEVLNGGGLAGSHCQRPFLHVRGGSVLNSATTTKSRPPLPPSILPITLGVFSQMLGEGISLSSLPLHLTSLNAQPLTVGLAISCFSFAQMTFAPLLVSLSNLHGRSLILRLCLFGSAISSILISSSSTITGVIIGRTLAGVFAACVPVAQSAVTEILPSNQAALGTKSSRRSAPCWECDNYGRNSSALVASALTRKHPCTTLHNVPVNTNIHTTRYARCRIIESRGCCAVRCCGWTCGECDISNDFQEIRS